MTLRILKKIILFLIPLFLVLTTNIYAGPPFNTDDPEPVDFRHWEYYLSTMHLFQPGFKTGTLPHIEINYGIFHNSQVHFLMPVNYSKTSGEKTNYGYANTEVGFKYRFWQSKDSSFQIGAFPLVEIPTISNLNFNNTKADVYLPLWLQKSAGKFTTYGGCGYWINPGTGNKNWLFAGWEVQYDFSKYLTLGGELIYHSAPTTDNKAFAGFNFGGFINFSENAHCIFSAGHSFTKDDSFMAYLGLLITI